MSGFEITLSKGTRTALVSLQDTDRLLAITSRRLTTGKRVNNPADGSTAFFTSEGFLARADDFDGIKKSISNAIQTVRQTSNAMDAIKAVINQAQGLIVDGNQSSDPATRASLATQFNGLLAQINNLVADATFNGTNLLTGGTSFSISPNDVVGSTITIQSYNTTASAAAGLNIALATNSFSGNTQLNIAGSQLERALGTLRTRASVLGNSNNILLQRQDYTNAMINVLNTSSDTLVLADVNEEGATLQALQARLQFGAVTLGITRDQNQALLRLF